MASQREQMEGYPLGQLADIVASGSGLARPAEAEILRRQTVSQQDAATAQQEAAISQGRAADAAEKTATYTRQNASYLLVSVIVLAFSSILTLLLSAFQIWTGHR